jgi:hypothetical protein
MPEICSFNLKPDKFLNIQINDVISPVSVPGTRSINTNILFHTAIPTIRGLVPFLYPDPRNEA